MWWSKSVNLAKLISGMVFSLSFVAIIKLQHSQYQIVKTAIENPDYLAEEQDLQTELNLRRLVPSFGYDNLVADSFYLEFAQYFGDEAARETTGYSLVPEYFTAIADRDPLFFDAYISLSVANSMYAGQAEQTVSLMNQILQSVPANAQDSYKIWNLKALDETLFLGDLAAANYSHQRAASLAKAQGDIHATSAIAISQQKAQFLATKPDTTQAQIMAWKSVLPNVVKEAEKVVIRQKIANLEAKLANSN